MKRFLTLICMTAALTACTTGRKATAYANPDGEWNIVKINGESVKTADGQDVPFIGFSTAENLVYGSTGCNRLTGVLKADLKTGAIDLSRMGSTRMMCPDMQLEQQVLEALNSIKTIKTKGSTMLLGNETGKTVMELERK